jgi:hypothetical protein
MERHLPDEEKGQDEEDADEHGCRGGVSEALEGAGVPQAAVPVFRPDRGFDCRPVRRLHLHVPLQP